MKIYTVIGPYKPIPLSTFTDYHDLIIYIRRRKFDIHKIYQSMANSWNEFDEVIDISDIVYKDAYSEFEHYKDKNYEIQSNS